MLAQERRDRARRPATPASAVPVSSAAAPARSPAKTAFTAVVGRRRGITAVAFALAAGLSLATASPVDATGAQSTSPASR
jgi:hypothetical protein